MEIVVISRDWAGEVASVELKEPDALLLLNVCEAAPV